MDSQNTIVVNIDDYLSEADKRSIVTAAFREICQINAKSNFERILSNAAYEIVRQEVNAAFDGDMVTTVKSKAIEVINNLSSYTVFKPADAWEKEASKGWSILMAELEAAQPLIKEKLEHIIAGLNEDDLRESLGERIASAILDKVMKP